EQPPPHDRSEPLGFAARRVASLELAIRVEYAAVVAAPPRIACPLEELCGTDRASGRREDRATPLRPRGSKGWGRRWRLARFGRLGRDHRFGERDHGRAMDLRTGRLSRSRGKRCCGG